MFATLKNKIDEKMPELSAKMKELGDKIVPPGQGEKEESPELLPLRALQQVPPMHSDGLPEKRLLVVLQPPEELPEAPAPAGTYSPVVVVGNMVHVSGIGPLAPEATSHVAKIGVSEDKEKGIIGTADGKAAARACALTMISVLRAQLGSLNHVKRLVNAKGFVNCTPDYTEQPEVMNGFSEMMIEVFGERGKGSRSAVGAGSLPRGWAVEVEAIFELHDKL
tara:strand:+ start:159 stop:824 length:666 start_codon:yes stop_codon:yes gene_type:complete